MGARGLQGHESPTKRIRRPDRPEPPPPWVHKDKFDAVLAELPFSSAIIAYDMVLGTLLRRKCDELKKDEMDMGDMLYMLPTPQV
jgi:hypothetical protein